MKTISKLGNFSSSLLSQPGNEEFQNIINLFDFPVFLINKKQGKVTFVNTEAIHNTGFLKEELLKLDLIDIFPNETTKGIFKYSTTTEVATSLTKRNGKLIDILITKTFLDIKKEWLLIFCKPSESSKAKNSLPTPHNINAENFVKILNSSSKETAFKKLQFDLQKEFSLNKILILKINENYNYDTINKNVNIDVRKKRFSPYKNNAAIILGGPKEIEFLQEGKLLTILSPHFNNSQHILFCIHNNTKDILSINTNLDYVYDLIQYIENSFSAISPKSNVSEEAKIKNSIINTMKISTEDGLLFLTPALEIKEVNDRIEHILGYKSDEIIGRKLKEIVITADGGLDINEISNVKSVTEDFGEYQLLKRNSESVSVKIKAIGIKRENKTFLILVRLFDLTEFENIKAREKKSEQDAILGNLMTAFAHDVRNPIQNINTGLELLSMDMGENPSIQKDITTIKNDGERLTQLMESILAYSKSFENKMTPQDLNSVVGSLLISMRNVFLKNNIKQYFNPPKTPSMIIGDKLSLERVFTNIFTNAINAMSLQDNGILGVEINSVKDNSRKEVIEIQISDTGPGIPKEDINKIFLPLYTTARKGNGIGLTITKQIIEAHRGQIKVESIEGGTIFSIRFPKQTEDGSQQG